MRALQLSVNCIRKYNNEPAVLRGICELWKSLSCVKTWEALDTFPTMSYWLAVNWGDIRPYTIWPSSSRTKRLEKSICIEEWRRRISYPRNDMFGCLQITGLNKEWMVSTFISPIRWRYCYSIGVTGTGKWNAAYSIKSSLAGRSWHKTIVMV